MNIEEELEQIALEVASERLDRRRKAIEAAIQAGDVRECRRALEAGGRLEARWKAARGTLVASLREIEDQRGVLKRYGAGRDML